jgi:hypothetical protein
MPNKNKSKNNKKFRRRRKRNTNYVQRHRTYPYMIRSTFLLQYPDYTLQNLNLNIVSLLQSNQTFNAYATMYQLFKLRSVQVSLTAVLTNGSEPPSGYIAFIQNESLSPQYSQLPTLPGTVKIKPHGTTVVRFSQKGRTDDFNKWYNTQSNLEIERMDSSIYLRFDKQFENDKGYYQGVLSFNILFQRPYYDNGNRVKETSETIKIGNIQQEASDSKYLELTD